MLACTRLEMCMQRRAKIDGIPERFMAASNVISPVMWDTSERGWEMYSNFLKNVIYANQVMSICDIGGGANPVLDGAEVGALGATYTILDISKRELEKAPNGYKKILADAASTDFQVKERFNLVFSKMVMEHVKNSEQFHRNVFSILKEGGIAVHFFPTLYSIPFVVNRLLSDRVGELLLNRIDPRDSYQYEKFPAYYSWCRGPSTSKVRRYRELGFHVTQYVGLFGHGYYKKVPLLNSLNQAASRFLVKHPVPWLTSYAYLVLRKPLASEAEWLC